MHINLYWYLRCHFFGCVSVAPNPALKHTLNFYQSWHKYILSFVWWFYTAVLSQPTLPHADVIKTDVQHCHHNWFISGHFLLLIWVTINGVKLAQGWKPWCRILLYASEISSNFEIHTISARHHLVCAVLSFCSVLAPGISWCGWHPLL